MEILSVVLSDYVEMISSHPASSSKYWAYLWDIINFVKLCAVQVYNSYILKLLHLDNVTVCRLNCRIYTLAANCVKWAWFNVEQVCMISVYEIDRSVDLLVDVAIFRLNFNCIRVVSC